jgi:hypothetical protein
VRLPAVGWRRSTAAIAVQSDCGLRFAQRASTKPSRKAAFVDWQPGGQRGQQRPLNCSSFSSNVGWVTTVGVDPVWSSECLFAHVIWQTKCLPSSGKNYSSCRWNPPGAKPVKLSVSLREAALHQSLKDGANSPTVRLILRYGIFRLRTDPKIAAATLPDGPAVTLGSPAGESGRCRLAVAGRSGLRMACQRRPDETIFPDREVIPQQSRSTVGLDQTAGFDHVGPNPQRDLPPISRGRPSRHGKLGGKAMTEIVAALLAFLSISVFLAHAFDAYRTG